MTSQLSSCRRFPAAFAIVAASALAFTGGAMLYSGTAEGEPTKKVSCMVRAG